MDKLEKPFEHPIEDRLNLDAFQPPEVGFLVSDYLTAAVSKGFREVRLIHSREMLGDRIEAILDAVERTRGVVSYSMGEMGEGGWYGETIVILSIEEHAQ
ncbi:MAG: Smr/MutS family protein [Candidatus Latescibacteria bacterium]|jgi:hypothetical protein|nr:Smr/MutS family protein [Candidatus Latescibacterota bacterium]